MSRLEDILMLAEKFGKREQVINTAIENTLKKNGIEFRRGLSGGGNQLKQPFFRDKNIDYNEFKNVEHVHNFSWYIGNYPSLNKSKIKNLLKVLNEVK